MIGNPHTLRTCIEHCPLLHALSIKKYFSLEQHTQSCPRGACRISGVYDLTEGVAWCAFLREQRTAWIRPHLHPTFVLIPNLFDSESLIEGCPRRACRVPGMYGVTAGEAKRARLCGRRTICSCPPFRTISIPNLFDSESRIEECPRRFRASGMYVTTAGTARRAILRGRRTIRSRPPHFIFIGGAY